MAQYTHGGVKSFLALVIFTVDSVAERYLGFLRRASMVIFTKWSYNGAHVVVGFGLKARCISSMGVLSHLKKNQVQISIQLRVLFRGKLK